MASNKRLFLENTGVLFPILIIISVFLRLAISQLGYNFDLTSWKLVGEEVLNGRNFYVYHNSYPYGPILSFLFAGLIF
ncbi:MAG: hypothetical protein K2Q22_11620, partial [Cytophagales bacterium]|nr:hypothetical protein [Cytophagales bacterium]